MDFGANKTPIELIKGAFWRKVGLMKQTRMVVFSGILYT